MSGFFTSLSGTLASVYEAIVAQLFSTRKDTEDVAQHLNASAANPRVAFRPNPATAPRHTIATAIALARSDGVEFEDDEFRFVVSPVRLGGGRYATYFDLDVERSAGRTVMVELRKMLLPDGRFNVILCPDTLTSDDAIVGTIAHEVHEASALRAELESNGGRLSAETVYSLVNPQTGTLHCAAWDHADEFVKKRQAKP